MATASATRASRAVDASCDGSKVKDPTEDGLLVPSPGLTTKPRDVRNLSMSDTSPVFDASAVVGVACTPPPPLPPPPPPLREPPRASMARRRRSRASASADAGAATLPGPAAPAGPVCAPLTPAKDVDAVELGVPVTPRGTRKRSMRPSSSLKHL
jgi:hypothetical protein